MSRASNLAGFSTSVVGTSPNNLIVGVVTATSYGVGTGTTISSPASDTFTILTGGSERVRVDSSGRLAVGTTSPDLRITVREDNPGRCISLLSSDGNAGGRLGTTGEATTSNGLLLNANRASGSIQFQTNSLERLRITSDGKLGIGTTSPIDPLHVEADNADLMLRSTLNTGNSRIFFADPLATNAGVISYTHTDNNLLVTINGSERARITSSGQLLVGMSSAIQADAQGVIQAAGSRADLVLGSNLTSGLVSGNNIGLLRFYGNSGGTYQECARISTVADGTHALGDKPSAITFSTTAGGASSPTERMRIKSGGVILFNQKTVAPDASNGGFALSPSTNERMLASVGSTSTAAQNLFLFYNPNGLIGTITTTGSATAYNTSSDYRLKENVTAVTDGITRLQQLKPSRFNFIADPTKTVDGFLAHEVQAIVPEAITGEKDAVDADGNPEYQGIDQSKLVPLLTAALQEAVAKIESLEARLTAAGI